jgi:hypothetical protein
MAEPMSQDAIKSDTEFDDGLGDWRYRARHFIRPTSPTDTRLRVASAIGAFVSAAGDTFEFPDFYAPAIYLSAAITADKAAKELREQIVTAAGARNHLSNAQSGLLFDFLEQSTVSAVFSFQALEAFCNDKIGEKLEKIGSHMVSLKGKPPEPMSAEEIERSVPTVDKLKKIVPELLEVDSPKDDPVWARFCTLKKTRDALTHLKTRDQRAATMVAAAHSARRLYRPRLCVLQTCCRQD